MLPQTPKATRVGAFSSTLAPQSSRVMLRPKEGTSQAMAGRGHHGSGVAGADTGLDLAGLLEADAGDEAGVLLGLEHGRGRIVHRHDIGRVEDFDARAVIAEGRHGGLHHVFRSGQDDAVFPLAFLGGLDGAFHDRLGCVVATHGV
jgi:hypothetical protein